MQADMNALYYILGTLQWNGRRREVNARTRKDSCTETQMPIVPLAGKTESRISQGICRVSGWRKVKALFKLVNFRAFTGLKPLG